MEKVESKRSSYDLPLLNEKIEKIRMFSDDYHYKSALVLFCSEGS